MAKQNGLQIPEQDSGLQLAKESSSSSRNASFGILYYGVAAGAVPFVWESEPGAPKKPFTDYSTPPPLSPPPSYLSSFPWMKVENKEQELDKFPKSLVHYFLHLPKLFWRNFRKLPSHAKAFSPNCSLTSSMSGQEGHSSDASPPSKSCFRVAQRASGNKFKGLITRYN